MRSRRSLESLLTRTRSRIALPLVLAACTSSNANSNASADAEPIDASADVVDGVQLVCTADAESIDASCTPTAPQVCTASLDAFCSQNECVRDWDTARDPCAWSFAPIVFEQPFAGYHVIDYLFTADAAHFYFYDIATKQLVAVGTFANGEMSCSGGPQGLVVPGPCPTVHGGCCAPLVGCLTQRTCASRDH